MIDPFVLLAPVLLLAVVALLQFVGCDTIFGLHSTTYTPPPVVSYVNPPSGPTAGGTVVTIYGSNFASPAAVTFGDTEATNVAVASGPNVNPGTQITATTPAGNAGQVTVTVTVSEVNGSLANGFVYSATGPIAFVQVKPSTPQTQQSSVSVPYPAAQTAGDLNIVVVGWSDATSSVNGVTDSQGNSYSLAIGPTRGTGLSQSIYYASNIKGGINTVTVTFSAAVDFPDIRVLEYTGLSKLDVSAENVGNSTTSSCGPATTTGANELIFGANTVATKTEAAGSGFTSRVITVPDGDIAEDMVVTTAGSYSATASLTSAGAWVMQMVTFY